MAKVKKVRGKGTSSSRKKAASVLPDSSNVPPDSLDQFISTIFGRKNIGKSSLAAEFPGNITLMFERGRKNLSIYQITDLDWETARQARDEIIETGKFQRVTLDTVDRAYDACFDWVCSINGIKHPDNHASPWMIWKEITGEFTDFIDSFRQADIGITFVSHEKIKPLVTKAKGLKREGGSEETSTVKADRIEPSCSGQPWGIIQEICDYVFYYGFHEGFRAITVRSPDDIVWTACGMGDSTFLDPNGKPIKTFRVGKSSKEAYQTLLKAFDNQIYDADDLDAPDEEEPKKTAKKKKPAKKKAAKKKVRR